MSARPEQEEAIWNRSAFAVGNGAERHPTGMAVSKAFLDSWSGDSTQRTRNLAHEQEFQRYVQHHSGHRRHFASVSSLPMCSRSRGWWSISTIDMPYACLAFLLLWVTASKVSRLANIH